MKNYPTSESYMYHLASEMSSIYCSDATIEDKIYLLDDLYIYKIWKIDFSDSELDFLNHIYDRYMGELLKCYMEK